VEAERKRERGRERGPWRGVEQCGGMSSARQRPSRGARCRVTVENGGVGVMQSTWLTGGPGRDGGSVISSWVRCGEAVGAALTGVGSTVRPIRFSNRIKLISNGFKFAPNFD
jgi:hypothetical protein